MVVDTNLQHIIEKWKNKSCGNKKLIFVEVFSTKILENSKYVLLLRKSKMNNHHQQAWKEALADETRYFFE